MNEEQMLPRLPVLVERCGTEFAGRWETKDFPTNADKVGFEHPTSRLVHVVAQKGYARALERMAALGYDMDVQRASDGCTPLHVAAMHGNVAACHSLSALGVDQSLCNVAGQSCGAMYQSLCMQRTSPASQQRAGRTGNDGADVLSSLFPVLALLATAVAVLAVLGRGRAS
jgi:hypothetical protein